MTDYLDRIGGPTNHPTYQAALTAVEQLLSDGRWHHADEVTQTAHEAAPHFTSKTIDNFIRWGHKRGRPALWHYRGRGHAKELRTPCKTA